MTSEGDVYCWGAFYGAVPTLVPGEHQFQSVVVSEAGDYDYGGFHACGTTDTQQGLCWGENYRGQLGNGENQHNSDDFGQVLDPVPVLGDLHFTQFALGDDNTCGITTDGSVYCWGQNGDGHLGTTPGGETDPTKLPGDLRFIALSSGRWFKCGITADQQTYCWGDDYLGQLGDGVDGARVNPVPARVLGVAEMSSVASGFEHTCGLSWVGGVAMCWGQNHAGQLNDGTTENRDSAVIAGLNMPSLIAIDAGDNGSCGLTSTGHVYCWGDMVSPRTYEPELVPDLPRLTSVSVGRYFACGVSGDDWIYCWGQNGQGQLGRSLESSDPWSRLGAGPISEPQ